MPQLSPRAWVPAASEGYVQAIAAEAAAAGSAALAARIAALAEDNRRIHEERCINLNPAANVMNPAAEALLARGLGSRPSLGYPGDKYEMGLEAVEQIEVIAAELAAATFAARFAEIRVPSGAIANLYAFMATCRPGERIIVPPAAIGGHVTHHRPGAAGLFALEIHEAPVDAAGYTVDLDRLRAMALGLRPRLITIGGSLNLFPHPVAEVRAIADEVGAQVLFDAAHLCGVIAGGAWPNPLEQGAHLMTMSTYKSLGGPPGGLVVTNDGELARRLDAIAFPGLTANFDVGRVAALAVGLLDWREHGAAYARAMVASARALAEALAARGLPVHAAAGGFTRSHQLALEAAPLGGGQAAARRLRRANLLASGIGLPAAAVEGDMNGLRLGTPEMVRWGMDAAHAEPIAAFIHKALDGSPEDVAPQVAAFRRGFSRLHYIRGEA
jgi:glycine hydroxymethyltransferase